MIEDYLIVADRLRRELTDLERLVQLMTSAFLQAQTEILAFAQFLEQVGNDP